MEYMSGHDAMHYSQEIVRKCGLKAYDKEFSHFGEWYHFVCDVIGEYWTAAQLSNPKNKAFALAFRKLYDNFDAEVKRDPAILYKPINYASEAFHKSQALIRYFRAGNRTSKTHSGYMENYYVLTGQHPYRDKIPGNAFIVAGMSFSDYLPKTFELKMIEGENGNPISPLFPEKGKWFNHYDARRHVLTVACRECAEAGKSQQCPSHHGKTKLFVFGTENSPSVLEGFAAKLFHIDESVPYEFFTAGQQRLRSVALSRTIITATPLTGPDSWENKRLTPLAEGPKHLNLADPHDPESPSYVELFTISQWDGNVVPKSVIRADADRMDRAEYEVRIMGRPAPLARNPVFPLDTLDSLFVAVENPAHVELSRIPDVSLVDLGNHRQVVKTLVTPEKVTDWTGLRVWEDPDPKGVYLVGVDTSAGLAAKSRDPSCAHVFRLERKDGKVHYKLVASFHGWIPVMDYAEQLKLLATWYYNAMLVVETTGGYGRAVLSHLQRQLFYPFIYRDTKSPEQFQRGNNSLTSSYGLETSVSSKPGMIGSLVQVLKDNRLDIRDQMTVQELRAYEQVRTDKNNVQYRAASGSHDDRVMAAALVVYVCEVNPLYFDALEAMRNAMVSSKPKNHNDDPYLDDLYGW